MRGRRGDENPRWPSWSDGGGVRRRRHAGEYAAPRCGVSVREGGDPRLLASELSRRIHDEARKGTVIGMTSAYGMWVSSVIKLQDPLADRQHMQVSTWYELTEAAERHNAPGLLTNEINEP